MPGEYAPNNTYDKLTVTLLEGTGPTSVSVPELDLLLVVAIAFSVLVFLRFNTKGKQ